MKTIIEKKGMRRAWLMRIIKVVADTRRQEERKFLGNKDVSMEAIPLQYMIAFKCVLYEYLYIIGEQQEWKLDFWDDLQTVLQDLEPALKFAIANAGKVKDGTGVSVEPFIG